MCALSPWAESLLLIIKISCVQWCCKPIDEERRKESGSLSSWTHWRSLISIAPPLFSRERKIMSFWGKKCMKLQKKTGIAVRLVYFSPLPSVPAVWIDGFKRHATPSQKRSHCMTSLATPSQATTWRVEGGQVFHTLTTNIPICKYVHINSLYIYIHGCTYDYMIFTDSYLPICSTIA